MSEHDDSRGEREPDAGLPRVRKGDQSFTLDKETFRGRILARANDPAFEQLSHELDRVVEVAWGAYSQYRKSPRTQAAGPGFADPSYEVPVEWLTTRSRILEAQARHDHPESPVRILVINGSARSDQTCPGEISKTYRLAKIALEAIESQSCEADLLDLSRLTGEAHLVIHPCKACVSTAQPLCHWPCSCYPNHALGQVNDWMAEIYPRWVAAHGVMILCPVNWYGAPSVLKLMIDRLVCADGGNPDPTTTHMKDARMAKAVELAGWSYPKHLSGRAFSVVVHADAVGAENLRRDLVDWMTDLDMIPTGPSAGIDRFVGYYEPYATSHDALDRDAALREETRQMALQLVETVRQIRSGRYKRADAGLEKPRKK